MAAAKSKRAQGQLRRREREAYERSQRRLPPPTPPPHSTPEHLLLRQISEKLQVIFIKVHNLQVEVDQLRTANLQAVQFICSILDDPDARHYAAAISKDFGVSISSTVKNSPV